MSTSSPNISSHGVGVCSVCGATTERMASQKDGSLICSKCVVTTATNSNNNNCPVCGSSVDPTSNSVTAINSSGVTRYYHTACIKCQQCGQQQELTTTTCITDKLGRVFCSAKCCKKYLSKMCAACYYPFIVVDSSSSTSSGSGAVTIKERLYHKRCLRCSHCKCALDAEGTTSSTPPAAVSVGSSSRLYCPTCATRHQSRPSVSSPSSAAFSPPPAASVTPVPTPPTPLLPLPAVSPPSPSSAAVSIVDETPSSPVLPQQQVLTFSVAKLLFGNAEIGGKLPIEEPIEQTFTVENSTTSASDSSVSFSIKPPINSTPRYDIVCTPTEAKLTKGQSVVVRACLVVHCTTMLTDSLVFECSVSRKKNLFAKEEVVRTVTQKLPFEVDSKLSTLLDYTEFVLYPPALGKGASGEVFRAKWRDQDCAIKVISNGAVPVDSYILSDFKRETSILQQLRHPHICHFFGACHDPKHLSVVMELFPCGSLSKAMAHKKFSMALKLKCVMDCATAMSFLHGNGIIHRDLKPDNLLVYSTSLKCPVNVKVTDFGTTRELTSGAGDSAATAMLKVTAGVGTPTFMAPEILKREKYSFPADVYSFAVLMYEVMTEEKAYREFKTSWAVSDLVCSGKRLPIPPSPVVPKEVASLISSCWDQTPSLRPPFHRIMSLLAPLLDDALQAKAKDKSAKKSSSKKKK